MDLNLFSKKKERIKLNYEEMLEVARILGLNDIEKNIIDSIESLMKDSFNIVVVGEFSRGKSTFINALVGKRILPSATKPTTTVINKISSGDEIEYILSFRDEDKTFVISEEEFKKLVAPIEPDSTDEVEWKEYNDHLKYISSISFANIKYPTKLLKEGVEIIDTPGTNDLDQVREEITFKFIPESDAAILVLSARQILSESEVTFLKERILANDINKIFFVINEKDRLLTEAEEKKVLDYAFQHLREYVQKPKIFLVSSKEALNYKRNANGETFKGKIPENLGSTGFVTLEKEICEYLINERGSIKLNKYYSRGAKIATEIIHNHIKLKLSVVDLPVTELEKKVNELIPKVRDTQIKALQLINQLKSRLKELENDYIFMYQNGLEEIALHANLAVTNYVGPLEIENIARYIEQTVAPFQKQFDQEIKDFKLRLIDNEINEGVKRLGTLFDNLNINIENKLIVANTGVSFTKEYKKVTVTDEGAETGDGLFGGLLIGGAALLLFSSPFVAVPAAIFGGKYLETRFQNNKRNNFLAEVKTQVERRYGDIIPSQVESFQKNYNKLINQSIVAIEANVNQKISSLEDQLNDLINEKKQASQNAHSEITSLTQLQKQLQTIITEFEREVL